MNALVEYFTTLSLLIGRVGRYVTAIFTELFLSVVYLIRLKDAFQKKNWKIVFLNFRKALVL